MLLGPEFHILTTATRNVYLIPVFHSPLRKICVSKFFYPMI